jgi:hypothetical protein
MAIDRSNLEIYYISTLEELIEMPETGHIIFQNSIDCEGYIFEKTKNFNGVISGSEYAIENAYVHTGSTGIPFINIAGETEIEDLDFLNLQIYNSSLFSSPSSVTYSINFNNMRFSVLSSNSNLVNCFRDVTYYKDVVVKGTLTNSSLFNGMRFINTHIDLVLRGSVGSIFDYNVNATASKSYGCSATLDMDVSNFPQVFDKSFDCFIKLLNCKLRINIPSSSTESRFLIDNSINSYILGDIYVTVSGGSGDLILSPYGALTSSFHWGDFNVDFPLYTEGSTEDRVHRLGQTVTEGYVDTLDDFIINGVNVNLEAGLHKPANGVARKNHNSGDVTSRKNDITFYRELGWRI